MRNLKKHRLTIRPAIRPEERHKIEDTLKHLGYEVIGAGTHMDGSECDISFTEINKDRCSHE